MRPGRGLQVGFDEDDDMQRLRELLVPQFSLVKAGSDVAFHGCRFEILLWPVAIIHLAPLLAMGTPTGIGTIVGQVQSRIGAQFGDQLHPPGLHHLPGSVVAKVPIQNQVGQREKAGAEFQ